MLIQTQPKASTSSVVLVNGKLTQTASLPLSGGRVKKFKCIFPGCDKSYTRPVRLEEHVRTHTGERPFKCPHCPSTFGRDSHLKAHLRTHASLIGSPDEEKRYACPDCPKKFWTNQHLKKHVEVIHKGKTYNCDTCQLSFRKHHLLRTHIAEAHAEPGALPFPCTRPSCSKSFKTNAHLKTHLKTHDPSRYLCAHPSCLALALPERQYETWTALQKHTKTDHPPRCPHPECAGKTFTKSRGLKLHLEVHARKEGGEEGRSAERRRKRGRGRKRKGGESDTAEETGGEGPGSGEAEEEEEEEEEESEEEEEDRESELERMETEREERMDTAAAWKGGRKRRKLAAAAAAIASTSRTLDDDDARESLDSVDPFVCDTDKCRKRYKSAAALASHITLKHPSSPLPPPPSPAPRPRRSTTPSAPRSTVAIAASLLDRLTGANYLSTRKFPCPFPAILEISQPLSLSHLSEDERIEGEHADEGQECKFAFKKMYDLERHLRSRHRVEVHREELEEWMKGGGARRRGRRASEGVALGVGGGRGVWRPASA